MIHGEGALFVLLYCRHLLDRLHVLTPLEKDHPASTSDRVGVLLMVSTLFNPVSQVSNFQDS